VKKLSILLFVAMSSLYASSGGETDILPRTINFLIFAGLVWYLLADKLKAFFASRRDEIVAKLDKIEDQVKASKLAKEQAEAKIVDARSKATEIIETAKKEAVLLQKAIEEQAENDINVMERSASELKEVEQNRMVREVVKESMEEILGSSSLSENSEELMMSLLKRVA